MEFGLLGPLTVLDGSRVIETGGPRQRTVLAHLVLRANHEVRQERLIDSVWGDRPPASARGSLQAYVSRLRAKLGPDRLEGHAGGYVLHAAVEEIDSLRFEHHLRRAKDAGRDAAAAAAAYRAGLDLWRGDALEDLAGEASLRPAIVRLDELRLTATEDWLSAQLELGLHGDAVATLEELVSVHPFRERFWAQLMLALYRSGRQQEAERTFHRLRGRLAGELGVDPWAEVQQLHARIGRQDSGLDLSQEGPQTIAARGAGVTARPRSDARNPYKGLRSFDQGDAADFHGRVRLVEEVLGRLRTPATGRFVVLVGPSGSGKSSAVRAGVLPALLRDAVPGSAAWLVATTYPGSHPVATLAAALSSVGGCPVPVDDLAHDERGLVRVAARLLDGSGSRLLLVVDQLEELFTLVEDPAERSAYLTLLATAVHDPLDRVRVVATLRADHYDHPLADHRVARLVADGIVSVTPLSPAELERAITAPAEAVGVAVEPALVAALVADVSDQPGSLPLLQYALAELFEQRSDNHLRVSSYDDLGGVCGALARRADDLHDQLSPAGRLAARQLFLRMVTLGEAGTADSRRRVTREELGSLDVASEAIGEVLEVFGQKRLLSFDRDPVTGSPTVEVAHEALLREWGRLRDWIRTGRDDVVTHRRLAAATREWVEASRDDSVLLRGERLRRLDDWVPTASLALTTVERDFLTASRDRREAEAAEEDARTARERALERRSVVRLRVGLAVVGVLAAMASVLTFVSLGQREDARAEARVATARELAAAATAALEQDPELSTLLALEAVAATGPDDMVLRQAEEALRRGLSGQRLVMTLPQGGLTAGVSADGARVLTAGLELDPRPPTLWDVESGRALVEVDGPPAAEWAALSPDGEVIALADRGAVSLHDARTGGRLTTLRGGRGFVTQPAFSPDGRLVVAGHGFGQVVVWRVDGRRVHRFHATDLPVFTARFSPDGSTVAAAGDDGHVRVWDLRTGRRVATMRSTSGPVISLSFSPDGRRVVTTADEPNVRIWDAATGTQVRVIAGAVAFVDAAFSPDGTRLVMVGTDSVAVVRELATGRVLARLVGQDGASMLGATFLGSADRVLTVGPHSTHVWDVSTAGGQDWATLPGARAGSPGVAFSPDGTLLAAPAHPRGVALWDTDTGSLVRTLDGPRAPLMTVAFSPDGTRLAAGSDHLASPRVWDVRTGSLLHRLVAHDEPVRAAAFAPGGRTLATLGADGIRFWDGSTGEKVSGPTGVDDPALALAYSPDGTRLAVAERAVVGLHDTSRLPRTVSLRGHTDVVTSVAFGDDAVVTSSDDGTVRVWDAATADERLRLRGHRGLVNQVAISPDGTRLATAGEDASTRLWDLGSGRELLTLPDHDGPVHGVAFSPDGRLLATASTDGTVTLHLLPVDELVARARERVTRELTDDECRVHLHVPRCP